MKWPKVDHEALLRKLTPSTRPVDMVLDTDTYNEVDDQFALAYSLLSPERLCVQAVYAAPFFNDRSTSPGDGMEKSYEEIQRLLAIMHWQRDNFVFKGSTTYLPGPETPVDSPAARDLIARAMAQPDDDPLYVVAIGCITNVASALLMEPRLIDKVVIVWLGGQPPEASSAREFNLSQDVHAARVVLDCGAPVVIVPTLGVSSHLLATAPDIKEYLGGKNPLCDALAELFCAYTKEPFGWAKEIWDVAAIAYLVNDAWTPSVLIHSPRLSLDEHWSRDATRHFVRVLTFAKRTPIFRDMYRKLGEFTC